MERRKSRRKKINFDDFPLYAEFFSGIEEHFFGHVQNISPNGLCIVLLNCKISTLPNTKGHLHLIFRGKTRSILSIVKWIDTPNHFVRYVGLEVDPKHLEPVLKEFFPDLLSYQ